MSPVGEGVSPFPAGRSGRTRLSVRGLTELLVELVGADGRDVIVLAIVPQEQQPAEPEGGDRPEAGNHVHRPVGLSTATERQPADTEWASLTDRERAVACLAGQALTNQQIARRLKISPHTVNFHLRRIFQKLGIDSRVSLAQIVHARRSNMDHGSRAGQPPEDSGPPEPAGGGVRR
ncbi:helix-turn-helix transcriptional regulator [Phytohabitans sp. ZYX-F-186]|uniref:Helix-turn-helix transcriptional regulator n=1 Tax=Phytohabitans maris TaxID=3071409 RepID=A0ABU0ZFA6_9ACTN|nr:helix-turn-helix transcriptional regulator [Phytohabitans sp. ZYX-F-186]MDQ7905663.1 helix-turn-helix transcriptional regulator [Phytohabitans sp. ZYX-F-186]